MSMSTERFSSSNDGIWISIDDAEDEFVMGTVEGAVSALNALQQQLAAALRHDTAMDLLAQENWSRVLVLEQQLADLQAKAALADEIFNGKWDWYDIAPDGGDFRCNYCDALAERLKDMNHHETCPKARYDALLSPSPIAPEEAQR